MKSTILLTLLALLATLHVVAQRPVATPLRTYPLVLDGRVANDAPTARVAGKSTFDNGDKIGIYASEVAEGATPESVLFGSSMFMHNIPVTKTASGWEYADQKIWPLQGTLAVYSYYPYDAATTATGSNAALQGAPLITYETPASKQAQQDLLYAWRTGLTAANGVISLPFDHALAQVRVRVHTTVDLSMGEYWLVVRDLAIRAVGTNKAQLNLRTGVWSQLSTGTRDYEVTGLPENRVPDASQSAEAPPYLDLFGETEPGFFFIPQSHNNIQIELTVIAMTPSGPMTETDANGNDVPQTNVHTKTLTSGQWSAGNVYVYNINIDSASFDDAGGEAPPDPDW